MDTSPIETRTEYRIETRDPRRRRWAFLAFTGAASGNLDTIRARLIEVRAEEPKAWRFRLATRQVLIQRGPWTPVPEEER